MIKYSPLLNDHGYATLKDSKWCLLNVCGLKSKLISHDFYDFVTNYDVVALTETKLCDLDDLQNDFHDFCIYVQNRSIAKRASGGIALLVKKNIAKYFHKIDTDDDFTLWFNVDSDLLGHKILLCVSYIPPENSVYSSLQMFDEIENNALNLLDDDASLCIMGDLNARTKNANDVLSFDPDIVDLSNDFIQKQIDHEQMLLKLGFSLTRTSQDQQMNNYGSRLLNMCKSLGVLISNGRCGKDRMLGETTCNNVSTVDYVLCSPELICNIHKFEVLPFCKLLSDIHNPIQVSFKQQLLIDNVDQVSTTSNLNENVIHESIVWNNAKKTDFKNNISIDEISCIESVLNQLDSADGITQDDIDNVVTSIQDLFYKNANDCGMVKKHCISGKKAINKRSTIKKPWFSKDCENKRKSYFMAKNLVKHDNCVENITKMRDASKEYKKALKQNRRDYYKEMNCNIKKLGSGGIEKSHSCK